MSIMNQDAAAAVEELEARFRIDHEQRRRLQAQDEERLQQAVSACKSDLAACQEEIEGKELALRGVEAKYIEELRVRKDALQAACKRETDLKRKHEAEIQQLSHRISRLKRLKPSDEDFPVCFVRFFHHHPQSQILAPFQTEGI